MSVTVSAIVVTLRSAALATLIIGPPCVLLSYLLARYDFPGKTVVSGLVSLPLVMPPTAVGYLLLRLLAVDGLLSRLLGGAGAYVLFTWKAVVIAYAVMAVPLMVRTMRVAFEDVDPRLEGIGRTLGYGPVRSFLEITLPAAARGVIAGLLLGFTRAIGEFGASITIAGNIAGKTRTLASAIYTAEQAGNPRQAYTLIAVAVAIGFVAIVVTEHLSRRVGGLRRIR